MWSSGVTVSWFSNLEPGEQLNNFKVMIWTQSTKYCLCINSSVLLLPSGKHGTEKSRSRTLDPAVDDISLPSHLGVTSSSPKGYLFSTVQLCFYNRPLSTFPGNFQELSLVLFGTITEPFRVAVFLFNRGRLTYCYPPIDMLRISYIHGCQAVQAARIQASQE